MHSVLILIDVQKGFYAPQWGKRNNSALETNLARLLAHWRSMRWPVIHVRHDSVHPESPLAPRTMGNDFIDEVTPRAGELVLGKTVNSAFIGTDLQARLIALRATRLTFVGISTDHCVSTSVRMAANLGFQVELISDATAAFPRHLPSGEEFDAVTVHQISLASLNGEFATVRTTDQIIEERSSFHELAQ